MLAGNPRRNDVRIVAVRDRDERPGFLDARLFEDLAVEAHPHDRLGVEPRGEPVECVRALVDDAHGVPAFGQLDGQLSAHAPTSHDDDVHGGEA